MSDPTCQDLCGAKDARQAEIAAIAALLASHQAYVTVYQTQLMTKTAELNQILMQISSFPGGCSC